MKLLIVCGPTATGKTSLAIALAKKFHGELINADSRQVYQGLDALTGKDRPRDARIWLYDVIDANEEFSVAHFVRLATMAIGDIVKRGKLPIIVGGTGFYLRALTTSIDSLAVPPDRELRKRLSRESIATLQKRLRRVHPMRWNSMNESDRKNPRRLIRAIEVTTSKKNPQQTYPRYDALWIGLAAPLPLLKQRITERVTERFDDAVGEVRDGLPPILGADPLLSLKRGEIIKEDALVRWAQAEYRYAKRQMTWFKKEKRIHWFDIKNPRYQNEVEALVREWYT